MEDCGFVKVYKVYLSLLWVLSCGESERLAVLLGNVSGSVQGFVCFVEIFLVAPEGNC